MNTNSVHVTACIQELRSELLAYQCQIEEFQRDLEAERISHQRTKDNSLSLSQQWKDLHQELMAKKKEV